MLDGQDIARIFRRPRADDMLDCLPSDFRPESAKQATPARNQAYEAALSMHSAIAHLPFSLKIRAIGYLIKKAFPEDPHGTAQLIERSFDHASS